MVYLHNSPLFHSSGCARLLAAVTCLAVNSILPRFEPAAVLHGIEMQRVTHVILVPTMLNRLLNSPEFAASDLSSLTHCVYGASIMPEAVLCRALARLPKVRFIHENVYSGEVENALHEHPGVRECAVIGLPHPDLVETVHAIVVLHAGFNVTEAELIAHCRALIAGYKTPRSVEFRHAPWPLSGTNKILKTQLRRECLARLNESF